MIGVKKPHFDMWGNTVNVASRMESTGRAGSIQVVEETATILQHFGFNFDQRGLISVKGKGKLMTYYLTGKQTPVATSQTTNITSSKALTTKRVNSPSAILNNVTVSSFVESTAASGAPQEPGQFESNIVGGNREGGITESITNAGNSATNPRNLTHQQLNCSQESLTIQMSPNSNQTMPTANNASDTSNKRMYITPSKRDFSTNADIHLL